MTLNYDILVIGAGHAGVEAATAAANMGARTCLVTMDMNKIAQMSCNPAVGGIAKGQIVREIDALGGQMAKVTDLSCLQFRMLNRSKGPAVWSPRAQCDRVEFIKQWRRVLDKTGNLFIWQDMAQELLCENGAAVGVRTIWGVELRAKAVILTCGTFLNGLMHIGKARVEGGRISEPAVKRFSESIQSHGIRSRRMKTGTPVRIDRRTVDFSLMEEQRGDEDFHHFSFLPESVLFGEEETAANVSSPKKKKRLQQLSCFTCYTNKEAHRILRDNFALSPLYNGQIQSTGPRYCPSIETKLHTFPSKEQHPLFLEPEQEDSNEMYLNGFSSSMPWEVQLQALRQIPALRNVEVYRPGYAIEYDYFDPTQLHHTLMSKEVRGLFLAGQVNGTTGYEEAAGQGLMAGINAALLAGGAASGEAAKEFVLKRDEAYIGVLIDDLTCKGVDEPYRMFTSRAEYRILLRQDDADERLTPLGIRLGLATSQRERIFREKQVLKERLAAFLGTKTVHPKDINPLLAKIHSTPLQEGCKIATLLMRPEITLNWLKTAIPSLFREISLEQLKACPAAQGEHGKTAQERMRQPVEQASVCSVPNGENNSAKGKSVEPACSKEQEAALPHAPLEETLEAVEIATKYSGYVERERMVASKMRRLEQITIKDRFHYDDLRQLSTEARQKLKAINPQTLGEASRIPGVSPNDINVLLLLLGR